jgi:hypothetical protein
MTPTEKAKQLLAMRQASERANVVSPAFAETTSVIAAMIDEVERLREALASIRDGHIPDAPMTSNDDELLWAQRWVGTLRRRAFDALAGEQGDDHE